MKNEFKLFKNGKNAETVWANPTTQEITYANRNSFGYNMQKGVDAEFDKKYGVSLKTTQGKVNYRYFYYSAKSMQSLGFQLVMRGDSKLW